MSDAAFEIEPLYLRVAEPVNDEFADAALDVERSQGFSRRLIEGHFSFSNAALQPHTPNFHACQIESRLGYSGREVQIQWNFVREPKIQFILALATSAKSSARIHIQSHIRAIAGIEVEARIVELAIILKLEGKKVIVAHRRDLELADVVLQIHD